MFDRILFPTDGSELEGTAFDHALDVAAHHGAELHLLHVADTALDSLVRVGTDVVDVLEREGADLVQEAADRARGRGVETVTEVLQGEPFSTIVDYADRRDVDLVVLPTHGRRGLPQFLLGSTTERVLRRSNVPVLTVRGGDEDAIEYPSRDVLVPTDGSDPARAALELGVDVAGAEDASLHLLSVIATASLGADVRSDIQTTMLEESAETVLESAAAYAAEAGVEPVVRTREYAPSVHQTILAYIDENDVDLAVVGTHGRTGFHRHLLGSVTEALVRTSPVPVLSVRRAGGGP